VSRFLSAWTLSAVVLGSAACFPSEPWLDPRTESAIYQAVLNALVAREAAPGQDGGVLVVNPLPLVAWLDESTHQMVVSGMHEFPSPTLMRLVESSDRWTICTVERLTCTREAHPRFVTLSDVILVSSRDAAVIAELVDTRRGRVASERLHLRVRSFRGEWNVTGVEG
jgi:hypothetical protein